MNRIFFEPVIKASNLEYTILIQGQILFKIILT